MSEAISDTYTATGPALDGVWMFDPVDVEATERQFLHAEGRAESLEAESTDLELVGREYAVTEFGEQTREGLALTVFVPFGSTHAADVAYWRAAVRARRPICYRDNRGRLMFATIKGGLAVADGRAGTALGIKLGRVDYSAAV